MYLARLPEKGKTRYRYVIRQSYADGNCYRSRDLFDLGDCPAQFIIYPGGNSFYIDTQIEDAIAAKGIEVTQDDLEPIFMPFLDPHIQRVVQSFDRKSRSASSLPSFQKSAESFHLFDRYRFFYLKAGQVSPRAVINTPGKFYASLLNKSRDEIECNFIDAEHILKPHELRQYTFQIFNLQRHFKERFAVLFPQALDQKRMDQYFIEDLCRLNQDQAFWRGSKKESGLHRHLIRYALMYFDGSFPSRDPLKSILNDFMNRHRFYRPPESVQVSLAESAKLFGVDSNTLKRMNRRELSRKYRKLAMQYHPDKGGDKETFIKLNAAFHKLLKRKN